MLMTLRSLQQYFVHDLQDLSSVLDLVQHRSMLKLTALTMQIGQHCSTTNEQKLVIAQNGVNKLQMCIRRCHIISTLLIATR